jgi:hypothetical protein
MRRSSESDSECQKFSGLKHLVLWLDGGSTVRRTPVIIWARACSFIIILFDLKIITNCSALHSGDCKSVRVLVSYHRFILLFLVFNNNLPFILKILFDSVIVHQRHRHSNQVGSDNKKLANVELLIRQTIILEEIIISFLSIWGSSY